MSKMGNLSINLVTTISGDAEKTKINQETLKIGKKKYCNKDNKWKKNILLQNQFLLRVRNFDWVLQIGVASHSSATIGRCQ